MLARGRFGNSTSGQSPDDYTIQAGHTYLPSAKTLSCPNFQPVPYTRPYGYNLDFEGGPSGSATDSSKIGDGVAADLPFYGMYGVLYATPAPFVFGTTTYTLPPQRLLVWGGKMDRFGPTKFLIREFDDSNDVTDWTTASTTTPTIGKGSVTLNNPGTAQPYSAPGGSVSFRHPYFVKGQLPVL